MGVMDQWTHHPCTDLRSGKIGPPAEHSKPILIEKCCKSAQLGGLKGSSNSSICK
jgi:hypothetical protein